MVKYKVVGNYAIITIIILNKQHRWYSNWINYCQRRKVKSISK